MSDGQKPVDPCVSVYTGTRAMFTFTVVSLPLKEKWDSLAGRERDQVQNKGAEKISRERGHMEEHKTTREESRGSAMVSFTDQPDILESPGRWASEIPRRDWFSYSNRFGHIHLRQHHSLGLRSLPIWVEKWAEHQHLFIHSFIALRFLLWMQCD